MTDENNKDPVPLGAANERASAEEMDQQRKQQVAYEYLCRLEEAKVWVESCIGEELPASTEMEECLRNGVYLAKLSNYFAPKTVPLKKVYDLDQTIYKSRGLHFRHTDNINHWLTAMLEIGMPENIIPETTDVYDKKNGPRVIYCLHALSLFLHSHGLAPKIEDLYGKVNFTEEEISAVSSELDKYGIQMPAFSTIGGVLAADMPVDEAALHASIIAINEAIDKNESANLYVVLTNPAAHLANVQMDSAALYQDILAVTKMQKIKNEKNRPASSDVGEDVQHDVYDEMLTRTEIQECLNNINCEVVLDDIKYALEKQDIDALQAALGSSCLGLKGIVPANVKFYMYELLKEMQLKKDNNDEGFLQDATFLKEEVQKAIIHGNAEADELELRNRAVKAVNSAIERASVDDLVTSLKQPAAQLPPILDFAGELYLEEFASIREENKTDLSHNELRGGIIVLSAVASINLIIDAGNADETFHALSNENAHIVGLDAECKHIYQVALENAKAEKAIDSKPCQLLTHLEIQECVILENNRIQEENDVIMAIHEINDALLYDDPSLTVHALCSPNAKLTAIDSSIGLLYHCLLQNEFQKKTQELSDSDDEVALWADEIQESIDKANHLNSVALAFSKAIVAVNEAVDKQDLEKFGFTLIDTNAQLVSFMPECLETYLTQLLSLKQQKQQLADGSGQQHSFLDYKTKDGVTFRYDLNTKSGCWNKSSAFNDDDTASNCLSKDEIQFVLSSVTSEYDKELWYKAMEPQIIQWQACVRGYLVRKAHKRRLDYLHSQTDAVLKIQAYWRGCKQRKEYTLRLAFLKMNTASVVKVQSYVRMHLVRKRYMQRLHYLCSQVESIVKIQTCWRASKTRKAFKELMNSKTPSFSSVQMFVHLLDINNLDFSEELDLYSLREEVVKAIRHNHQLEKDLCTMDLKIGLLVKNRISLQDVIAHENKMSKKAKENKEAQTDFSQQQGLKSLSKRSRQKLEAYQHVFYLLQSEPRYLSRLIFLMLPSKTAKFIESIVLAIFNFASNLREEYLLLKLFRTALREEISCKIDQPGDLISGNPLIIKMIVGFNRNRRGQSSLCELLGPLVKRILDDKNLHINTNPVEVYRAWVNQLETVTGQPSQLPYNVSQEDALHHEEVRKRLEDSVLQLKEMTLLFFNAILSSLDKIPYGMLYMAKVLKNALTEKFPDSPQKEILKVVGNLLYYRYINSAIVAPDAFDIVEIGANQSLTNEQRRNLGSIAKILQFATSKTGFGDESPHLVSLNPFIIECHERFKKYFQAACEVEELEDHFKVDEYTEATMLTKPVIYVSCDELCELHLLLLEHENALAPDQEDPIHEILEDLGEKPNVEALIGENLDNLSAAQLAKTEVCLTLTNKLEIPESNKDDMSGLYVRTKQLVVDAIHCLEASDLADMLKREPNSLQCEKYISLCTKRLKQNEESEDSQLIAAKSSPINECADLKEVLTRLQHNLHVLELAGFVTSKNKYQDILNTVALDIRNRRRYRMRRKQDLLHLRTTLSNLKAKTNFYEEQVDYYIKYIKQCLDNMAAGSKKMGKTEKTDEEKLKSKITVKYTASKLAEKGIITSIDGLTSKQFKNVLFEISPSNVAGVFAVKVKYLGTPLADIDLDIQNLLELQYEGVAVMKMFDRAQINVNLLLHLLNSKFYGRFKKK